MDLVFSNADDLPTALPRSQALTPWLIPSVWLWLSLEIPGDWHQLWPTLRWGGGRLVAQSCPALWDPIDCRPPGSSVHGIFPGKVPGVGCHCLPHGIFPTQAMNLGLLHYRKILYRLSYQNWLQKHFFFFFCNEQAILVHDRKVRNCKQATKRNRKEILHGSLKNNHAWYILLI